MKKETDALGRALRIEIIEELDQSIVKNNWSGIDIQLREHNKIVVCSAESWLKAF